MGGGGSGAHGNQEEWLGRSVEINEKGSSFPSTPRSWLQELKLKEMDWPEATECQLKTKELVCLNALSREESSLVF